MASEPSGSSRASPEREAAAGGGGGGAGGGAGGGGGGGAPGAVHHPCSFKLRFAAQREPGRSNVSLVKPLGLPAVVSDKGCAGVGAGAQEAGPGAERALRRVQDAFRLGPRDKYAAPVLTSHEAGWWVQRARREPAELRHHIRDSWWLRERVRRLPPVPLAPLPPLPPAARKR